LVQTEMWITSKSLNAGLPLSVARTVTGNVPLEEGAQLKAPVEASIVAPDGAPASSENVNVFAGTSASVAVAVNDIGEPAATSMSPMAASTGGRFTSRTVIAIVSKSFARKHPSSVTRTVMW